MVREVIGLKDQNNYLNAETCKSENAPNENPKIVNADLTEVFFERQAFICLRLRVRNIVGSGVTVSDGFRTK